jgi:hypothetical protein
VPPTTTPKSVWQYHRWREAKKCGTTFLYGLLTRHPHVEPAAKKELHYFDVLFEPSLMSQSIW